MTIKPTKILETKTDGKKREAINLPQCQLYYTVHNKGKCNKFTLMSCHKLDMAFQELNAYKDETLLLLLLWALNTEVQKRVSLMGFGSHPRGVESPSTRQLELQLAWNKGGILRPVQS